MNGIKNKFNKFFKLTKKAIYFAWYRHHFLIPPRVLFNYIKSFKNSLTRGNTSTDIYTSQASYLNWLQDNKREIENVSFLYNPKYSFVLYVESQKYLDECLNSLLAQNYDNYEICLFVNEKQIEKKYLDNKKVVLNKISGDYIVLVNSNDVIEQDSLYQINKILNENKDIDFIYSDEDRMDINGKYYQPHFKPDFSYDTLMSLNYIGHLSCIKKELFDKVGGINSEYKDASEYDLFLKIVEKTNKIYHLPIILNHGRDIITYKNDWNKKVIEKALERRKLNGTVEASLKYPSGCIVKYQHNNPLVSIIIPIKDQAAITKKCLDSLYNKNTYQNFEIILVDNGSKEKATLDLLDEYNKKENFTVLSKDCQFNYAYLNNEANKIAKGEYLLFLNNDTEVIQEDFLDYMVGYAQLSHVGCVGIKLLYPDNAVQHAGVVLGFGGIAGHVYQTADYDDTGMFARLLLPYNYSAVTAACLLISKEKFEQVGGFDEFLKVSANDVDLNLKVLNEGYFNVCLSNVEMKHYESKSRKYASSSSKQEQFLKEQEYMRNKWQETIKKDKYYSEYYF